MTNYSTRDAYEADTYRLFGEFDAEQGKVYDPYLRMAATVFKASCHSCLTVDRIVLIAEALCNFEVGSLDKESMKVALRKLTKAKVLRSVVSRGVRRYEVNY